MREIIQHTVRDENWGSRFFCPQRIAESVGLG